MKINLARTEVGGFELLRLLGSFFDVLDVFQFLFTAGAGIFLLIASARLVGMEYTAATIRVLLARGVGRLRLLAAKMGVLALVGLILLAGHVALCALLLGLMVRGWEGSVAPLTSLPTTAWHELGLNVLASLVSLAICILLGTAAAAVGRSLGFALAAALAFFPADNFAGLLLLLATNVTGQHVWADLTAYLLGPNLNELAIVLQTDHTAHGALVKPAVPVDTAHVLAVVTVYAAAFAVTSLMVTWRRDIRE